MTPASERLASARRLILYTGGRLADRSEAKTAWAVLRFQPERVSAVIDEAHAGSRLLDVCPILDAPDLPVVGALEAVGAAADALVVGFAPNGGRLTPDQRELLVDAAGSGLTVVNGLHETVDDPNVVNLRWFDPADRVLATGAQLRSTRLLTVGTSASIGKMTASVLLTEALRAAGLDADWLPTGQTGVILQGFGHVIDAVPIDFVPGILERDVLALERDAGVVVVEGQGSIHHPTFAPAAFALFQACRPQWYVISHRLGASSHTGFAQRLPSVSETVRAHAHLVKSLALDSRLLGICLDSSDVSVSEYESSRDQVEDELGVPCRDPIREGIEALTDRLVEVVRSRDTASAATAAR